MPGVGGDPRGAGGAYWQVCYRCLNSFCPLKIVVYVPQCIRQMEIGPLVYVPFLCARSKGFHRVFGL